MSKSFLYNIHAITNFCDHTKSNVDLNICSCGFEQCKPEHTVGPLVRDHYLLHYIVKGHGYFKINDVTYELSKGQGFLIPPNALAYYASAEENPWQYFWVGFNGAKASHYIEKTHLSIESPILQAGTDNLLEDQLTAMVHCLNLPSNRDLLLLSHLYSIFYTIIENNQNLLHTESSVTASPKEYVVSAITYIEHNFFRNITITDISKYLNVDRSYLHKLFKQYLGTSPQQFLINYRIERACQLLQNEFLLVGHIAASVGYSDALLFSKIFKKYKGISPSEYRLQLKNKKR
ncbi:MAG: AraC family ligand binding domain-containing protein [Cellulosilyticaceae bacterium]